MLNPSTFFSRTQSRGLFLAAFYIFLSVFTMINHQADAACCNKIEVGPTYIHLDVLEKGHTIEKLNMAAGKLDGTLLVWKGVCLKPTFLYARQGHSEIISGGCGLGHYFPIGDKCSVTPSVGCNFTQFKTTIHDYEAVPGYFVDFKERFRSVSPYACIDASYCFVKGWRIVGSYQYVWSTSRTAIKGMKTTKSTPEGSNFGLMLEGDINDNWSASLGAAYNSSLTKEKHGLRGYGVRLGLAYWF